MTAASNRTVNLAAAVSLASVFLLAGIIIRHILVWCGTSILKGCAPVGAGLKFQGAWHHFLLAHHRPKYSQVLFFV
ncbi:hypothetical protein OUZ56_004142 [Daphnia magna]|uniref:Uncharacterized protein n=1 Tax=Daphnia magna TaxID=35525 RepID=A0ABQ9YP30_9CRUS|nr:hypothetical protein OUZ56_004142 [Daphnia magna]